MITRIGKLFNRTANERYRSKFDEFVRLLEATGFVEQNRKGSHRTDRHPGVQRILTIQPKGNMAQGYQVAEFLAMVRDHALWTHDL